MEEFTSLKIILDEEQKQLDELDAVPMSKVRPLADCRIIGIRNGTKAGNPAVIIRFDLEDGAVAIKTTTLKLFLTVADTLRAKYGDPRKEGPESVGGAVIWPNN